MLLPEVKEPPKFEPGRRVWIIQQRTPCESSVLSVRFELCHNGRSEPVLIHTGYQLGVYRADSDHLDNFFAPYKVYGSEEEAAALCAWHPMEGISESEWQAAIGNREDEEGIEACELSRCCANVSAIRDLLFLARNDGGLIERDRQKLIAALSHHSYPMPDDNRPPNLDKILTELGITVEVNDGKTVVTG